MPRKLINLICGLIIIGITLSGCLSSVNKAIRKSSRKNKSKVIFGAYYSGTQNGAVAYFHNDDSFYANWTGIGFNSEWWSGKWKRGGDTLYLEYDYDKPLKRIGDTIVLENNFLVPLNDIKDSSFNYNGYFQFFEMKQGKK